MSIPVSQNPTVISQNKVESRSHGIEHAVVAQPGTASALRADFRKDFPVQIRATAFSLLDFVQTPWENGWEFIPEQDLEKQFCYFSQWGISPHKVSGRSPEVVIRATASFFLI